jgi:hypothetical protein
MSGTSRVALIVGVVIACARAAGAQQSSAPSSLPKIAVGQIGEFHVARTLGELGPDVVIRAAAQGVRDSCFGPDDKLRPVTTCERPAPNAPAGVCVDTTLYRALAPLTACDPGDRAPEALELQSPCRTTECITADAKAVGATHIIVIQGRSTEFGLDLALDLITLASGQLRSKRYRDYFPATDRNDAEILPRTGPQIVAIVHGMARDVVSELLLARSPAPAAVAPPVPAVTAPVLTESPRPHAVPRWVGWTVAGAGVAAVVAGAIFWAIDGDPRGCTPHPETNDHCLYQWDSKKLGIPLVIGGAVGAGVGGWLIYRSAHSEVAVSPSVAGVGVQGRF